MALGAALAACTVAPGAARRGPALNAPASPGAPSEAKASAGPAPTGGGTGLGPQAPALAQPVQRRLPLRVQVDVGFLTAQGLAKANAGGGALIANDGTSLQPGSASRFAAGDGSAQANLKLSGMAVSSQDAGYLVGGGGIISNDGGGIISNDGGGIISNDGGGIISNDGGGALGSGGAVGFRLAQNTGLSLGQIGPVGGFQFLVVDLHDRLSYLVAAEGGRGLFSDAQGQLELPLPAALKPQVRNVLAIAIDPKHPELRQASLVRVDGARAEANESRTLITSYLRRHYTKQVGGFFQTEAGAPKAGEVRWGSDLQVNPLVQARLLALSKSFHAAGLEAMRRAGQQKLSAAQANWLAQIAFDRALALLDLDGIAPNYQSGIKLDPSVGEGEARPGVPFAKDALGLMEQCLQELHEQAKAKLEEVGPEALAQSPTVKEAEARMGRSFPIQRPQDYLDFVVEAFLLEQRKLDDEGEVAARMKTEGAFANVGARRASWTRLRAGASGFAIAAVLAMGTELKLSEVVDAQGELDLEAALQSDLLQAIARQGESPAFRALAP